MRPVRLTFSGLRSYRDETTIDFTDLKLFAVIGDTGAGKSTIIEALCLALYGRRTWQGSGKMVDMICDGVNTLRIELAFSVGDDLWTVTRARHRNSSAPIDKLVDANGGPVADGARNVTDTVSDLVGLTFEQFTRAVVLPQGRFDSLLKAGESERNKILTSILDLGDVVVTREKADGLLKEWKPKTDQVVGRRQSYPPDPPTATRTALRAAVAATDHKVKLEGAAELVDEHLSEVQNLERAVRDLRAAASGVRTLRPDPESYLVGLGATWVGLQAELQTMATELADNGGGLTGLDELMAEVLNGFASRDALISARTRLEAASAELPRANEVFALRTAERSEAETARPDPEAPSSFKEAADLAQLRFQDAEAKVSRVNEQLERARSTWAAWTNSADRVAELQATLAVSEQALESANASLETARTENEEAQSRAQLARSTERDLALTHAAREAAASCVPGDPCPVCERPLPHDFVSASRAGSLTEAEVALGSATERASVASRIAAERSTESASAKLHVERVRDDLRSAEANSAELAGEVAALGLDAGPAGADPLAELSTEARSAQDELAGATDDLQAKRSGLAASSAAAVAATKAHDLRIEQLDSAIAAAKAEVARHMASVNTMPATWLQIVHDADETTTIPLLVAALETATVELGRIDDERARLGAEREQLLLRDRHLTDTLNTTVHAPLADTVRGINEYVESVVALATAVNSSAPGTVVDSEDMELLAPPTKPSSLHKQLAALGRTLSVASETCAVADRLIADRSQRVSRLTASINSTLAEVACASSDELRTALGTATAEQRHATSEAEAAQIAEAEAAKLDELLKVAVPFTANLSLLVEALRDSNFIAHLVDAREQELLSEAARRLMDITKGRFAFTKDFGVMSVASGEVRDPEALSGGERFQAALALALALVEIASRGGGRLDAVFVDEGFGSLDSNALDVALETLGGVAVDGKSVALISHLRPVAEYVDTVLHVTKDDLFGSRIDVLDAEAKDRMLDDDIRSGLTS